MMTKWLLVFGAMGASQDPCADCGEHRAIQYQKCAMEFGNPCKKDAEGKTADISCCRAKGKHDRCLSCAQKDCTHDTCEVNKKYYNFHAQKKEDKDWDKKAMKESGWGFF